MALERQRDEDRMQIHREAMAQEDRRITANKVATASFIEHYYKWAHLMDSNMFINLAAIL